MARQEDVFELVLKRIKTRVERDVYYKALEQARFKGFHEEFAEHVLDSISTGYDAIHAVDLAKEYLDL